MRATHLKIFGALLAASWLGASADCACAQDGCSRLVAPNGSVTMICPPASADGGHWRGSEFVPSCPANMVFRREQGQCIPAQNYGGVIPCSEDDKTYVPGQGWISNCRERLAATVRAYMYRDV